MTVKRITANIAATDTAIGHDFYHDLFGLEVVMDLGWIVTLAAQHTAPIQLSIASEGGSGTPVPDLSIEVDDVDSVYEKAKSHDFEIVYPLTDEPWGVRRFYVRDPCGKLINVLGHQTQPDKHRT